MIALVVISTIQINDAMDMNADNVDEQADDVYSGILGEIGLEYTITDPVSINNN